MAPGIPARAQTRTPIQLISMLEYPNAGNMLSIFTPISRISPRIELIIIFTIFFRTCHNTRRTINPIIIKKIVDIIHLFIVLILYVFFPNLSIISIQL